ncbi:MAG: hypothetical protein HC880_01695 [Bacteroidia bacterium]|nr:hypothetical protein [Bacteroidia bacterium]
MMSVSILKNNIYQLLDRIENTEMLQEINYILADYVRNYIENPVHTLDDLF